MPYDDLYCALARIAQTQPSEGAVIAAKVLEAESQCYDMHVVDFGFSVRATNVLIKAGLKTIRQVSQKKSEDFLRYRNCGLITLTEIKYRLGRIGIKLSNEELPELRPEPKQKPKVDDRWIDWQTVDKLIKWNAPLARQAARYDIDKRALQQRRRILGQRYETLNLSQVDWSKSDLDLELDTGYASSIFSRWREFAAWDWTQRDILLAETHMVTRERVRQIREKLGHEKINVYVLAKNLPCYPQFANFTPEMWKMFNHEIASRYGVSVRDVVRLRRLLAPGTRGRSPVLREIEKIGWGTSNRDITQILASKGINVDSNRVSAFRQQCAPATVMRRIAKLNPAKWDWDKSTIKVAEEHGISQAAAMIWRRKLGMRPFKRVFTDWSRIDWSKSNSEISAETKLVCGTVANHRRINAPSTVEPRGYDWSRIDWSKSNSEISKSLGCAIWTVYFNRNKYSTSTILRRRVSYDWSVVNWSKTNKQIAFDLGCDLTTVYSARKRLHD